MSQYVPDEQLRKIIAAPDPRPRDLGAYRIFTDEDRIVFMAARMDGDRITVVAEAEDEADVINAVLEDAGLRVPTVEVDMDLGGRSYKPKASDWK